MKLHLTFKNSTFCQTVNLCVLYGFQEPTVIISLHRFNRWVSITETECVYCAVRTGYMYVILVKFCLQC